MNTQYRNLSDYLRQTSTRIEAFAARVGIGAPYVSMLANGLRTPSLRCAVRIATEARIPIESLLPVPSAPTSPEAETT